MTEPAHYRDIDEMADKIPDKYLTCRVNGHSRIPSSHGLIADMEVHPEIADMNGAHAIKTKRCRNRCGVVWFEVQDEDGNILWESGADYTGAPGYLAKGVGRLNKSMRSRLRKEEMLRFIEQDRAKTKDVG